MRDELWKAAALTKSIQIDQFGLIFGKLINSFFNLLKMNDTDRQLLALLRDNARMSVTELSKKLRVSNRLEMTPTIIGHIFGFRCAKSP